MKIFHSCLAFLWITLLGIPLSTCAEEAAQLTPKSLPGFAVLGTLGLLPASSTVLTYGGWFAPYSTSNEINQQRVTLQVPIFHDGKDSFSLSTGAASLHFSDPQTLDSSGIVVPLNLWRIDFGGAYSHNLDDNKLWGARLSIGSASDQPFNGLGVTTVGSSAFYSWESSENSRWMLTLFFSNNNPIINYVPIPGFLYIYQTKTFIGMFGIPLTSMVWRPDDVWMFTLAAFGPTINAEIAYGDPQKIQTFTGFSWSQQSFLREDRPDPNDRLYFDEKHLPLGVRFPIGRDIKTDLSVGYAFDGSVYEGSKFGKKENGQSVFGNAWYGAWNFRVML